MDLPVLSAGAVLVLLFWLSQGTAVGAIRLTSSLSSARHRKSADSAAAALRACIVASNSSDCPANERCMANSNRIENGDSATAHGQCQCIDGYSRSAPDNLCRLAAAAPQAVPSAANGPGGDRILLAGPEAAVAAKAAVPTRSGLSKDQVSTTVMQGGIAVALSSDVLSTTTVTAVSSGNTNLSANMSTATIAPKPTARVVYQLAVSAGEDVVLRHPNNTVELTARFQLPARLQNDSLKYSWTLVQLPANTAEETETGVMRGLSEPTLKLTKLIPGVYRVKLVVDGANEYGQCFVNITVLPPARINQAPKATIKPSDQQITHGNSAVLDGSESTDDDGIAGYSWEVTSAPVSARIQYLGGRERQMLQLSNLVPGQYSVRLTVTDTDGIQNSTTAKFTIIKEVDYPPKANAGSDVIISMPQNEVVLMGNASTDDKGIVSYEWTKTAGPHAVDISGARTSLLKLSNLQPGDYTFTLRVTDAADQSASDDVQVFVKQELNHPPVAVVANSSVTVRLVPGAAVQLDGSRSSDDHGITRYEWTQLQGPNAALLQMPDHPVATASGLIPGVYQFRLTVDDENQLKSSAVVEVQAIANINRPPVAHGCGNVTVTLPRPLLLLDGSRSNDEDGQVVSYKWARQPASPAAGAIIDGSDREAVLKLAGPVAGRYVWILTVTDDEGQEASDKCTVNVLSDPNDLDTVELFLEASVEAFSEANKDSIASELSLLLRQPDGATAADATTSVKIVRVSADSLTGLLAVSFVVYEAGKASLSMRRGTDVVRLLREKLRRNADVLDFKVHSVDTLICQNNCSGHGYCSPYSKRCVCDSFWMKNVFRSYVDSESNCEWSIVYVVVIGAGVAGALLLLLGLCTCACRRRCCTKQPQERRRVYQLIDCLDGDDSKSSLIPAKRRFMLSEDSFNNNAPKGDAPPKQQSLLLSDSELSSDEDTLFVNSSNAAAKVRLLPPGAGGRETAAALTGSGNDASRA